MSLLLFLLFGFLVGLVARALMPGNQGMGIIMTALLGVGGSLVGGFLSSAISGDEPLSIHSSGLIGSILGAMIVLAIAGAMRRKA
jgi:uncharacterized membrane protein YeaQ/YmgE (transglycosylase-associated protein family)